MVVVQQAATDSITLTTANLPAHTHDVPVQDGAGGVRCADLAIGNAAAAPIVTDSTGSGTAFAVDTLPPFYTVVYIMRVR